jgi:hypothetical protein
LPEVSENSAPFVFDVDEQLPLGAAFPTPQVAVWGLVVKRAYAAFGISMPSPRMYIATFGSLKAVEVTSSLMLFVAPLRETPSILKSSTV